MSRRAGHLRRLGYLLEYGLARALAGGVAWLPRRAVWELGGMAGRLAYWLLPARRRLARGNVARALPDRSPAEVERIARASFVSFGRTLCDAVWSFGLSPDRLARWVEIGEEVYAEGRRIAVRPTGTIVALAHFGNWEMLGLAWGRLGNVPLAVVAKPLHNPWLDRWVRACRERAGNRVIPSPGAARAIARSLASGSGVAIVMDQRTPPRYGGLSVPFFGRPAPTSKSPAAFSLSLSAPILVVSCLPDADGVYHVRVSPPLEPQPGEDRQADLVRLTERLNRLLEEEIRRAPEHYFWMHDRWGERR